MASLRDCSYEDASSSPLSQIMKEGSRDIHRAAENTPFVREIMKGQCPIERYLLYLEALAIVYRSLEQLLERYSSASKAVSLINHSEQLRRSQALEDDIAYYRSQLSPIALQTLISTKLAAPERYVRHLNHVAESREDMLIAHGVSADQTYTRYMGDLSGGQILARKLERCFSLPESDCSGREFYQFRSIPDTRAFKEFYRLRLDEAGKEMTDHGRGMFVA